MTVTTRILVSALVLACLAPSPASAGDSAAPTPSAPPNVELLWHETPTLVPVRLVFPAGFEPRAPHTLVVALHGYGSSAVKFRRVADELAAAGFLVALPEATYAMPVNGDVGFDWTLVHRDDEALGVRAARLLVGRYLPDLVGEIRERYAVDGVHVLGFSQGASVALLAGIYDSADFDGVVSFGLPAFDLAWFEGDVLASGRGVRVLLVHGDRDERAAPEQSRRAREQLRQLGYDVTLRTFEGGHSVPADQLAEAGAWIRDAERDE